MKLHLYALFSLLSVLGAAPLHAEEFDPRSIDWTKVESKFRWLNLFFVSEPLGLWLGDFPAVRWLGPGRYYPETKFPAGTWSVEIRSAGNRTAPQTAALKISERGRTLLVTHGNQTLGLQQLWIHEAAPPPEGAKHSSVRVYNLLPGRSIEVSGSNDPVPVRYGSHGDIQFPAGTPAQVAISVQGGRHLRQEFPDTPPARWMVFVHFDSIGFDNPVVTRLAHGSSSYAGPEETAVGANQ